MGADQVERSEPRAAAGALALPLLATKLALPVPASMLVPRPRLTAHLDATSSARLALVVAPAGSGKSSLLSQWCQQRPEAGSSGSRRVAWLSLDEGDSEPARFLLYLCAALEHVAPEAAGPVRALFQSSQPPTPDYAVTLLLTGLTQLTQRVTLVLDDYHRLEAGPVHQLVTFLLERLPPNLFLILASRRDPPLPLSRLRLQGQLVELSAADLRFTGEEAAIFLNESMGLSLAPEAVARLTQRTEGWIAGLQMAALSLQGVADPDRFVDAFTGSNRYLVDYLFEEVLGRQPPEVQSFLRQTAILQRLCGSLCEAVTGRPGGQAMLEQVEAANLFLIPLDEERRWYRYHHLFADVLRAGPQPPGAEPVAALHARAAGWYETEGLIEEALEHALAGGQPERVARLIEQHYLVMAQRGEFRRMERYLQALPSELIQTRPLLAIALGSVYLHDFRFTEVEQLLEHGRFELGDAGAGGAEGALLGPDPGRIGREADSGGGRAPGAEARDLGGKLLALRGHCAVKNGSIERAVTLSQQALEWLAPANLIWRTDALTSLAVARVQRGELGEAALLFAEAIELSLKCESLLGLMRASHAYGQLCESQGALGEAERIYRTAVEYARQRRRLHVAHVGPVLAALGRLCYQRNDRAGATEHLEAALRSTCSEFAGLDTPYAAVCYIELLRLQTARGQERGGGRVPAAQREGDWRAATAPGDGPQDAGGAAAAETLERLAAAIRPHTARFFEPLLTLLRVRQPGTRAAEVDAWLAAFEAPGRLATAPALAFPGLWLPEIGSLEIVTWARLRLARGQGAPVISRLEEYLEQQVAAGRHGSALPVRVLLSTLYWQAYRQDRAVAVLEPALSLAEREGHVRDFLDAGAALVPVLRSCAAQGIAPEWSNHLLAAWEAARRPSDPSGEGAAAGLREPLSEREREVLGLLAQGLSNEQMAAKLFLSVQTVKRHLHHIYGKLEVTTRLSAVARARELGLL